MVARSFYENISTRIRSPRDFFVGYSSQRDLAEALVISRDIEILALCVNACVYDIRASSPGEKSRLPFEGRKRSEGRLRERQSASFPLAGPSFSLAFWIFCRSGHVSIIESLASAATDEFQLVAGWPVSRGPRMGFPGFCTSSFHGTTRSFAFRPYLLHLLHHQHLLLLFAPFSSGASRASSISRSSISPSASLAESLSIPICLSFHPTEPQTFCRELDVWISRASKPATELAQSGCEN